MDEKLRYYEEELNYLIESGREFFLVLNHHWLEENSRFHSRHKDFGAKVRWTFRF